MRPEAEKMLYALVNASMVGMPVSIKQFDMDVANQVGVEAAFIYAELVDVFYWKDARDELNGSEWFDCTFNELEKRTSIKERTARGYIKKLETFGFIETKLKGIPAVKHYRLK